MIIEYNYYHLHQFFVSALYLSTDKALFPQCQHYIVNIALEKNCILSDSYITNKITSKDPILNYKHKIGLHCSIYQAHLVQHLFSDVAVFHQDGPSH